jgi:NDP-4-keto-2,6-dideoxyhexose 3-C-methyltransferase
VAQARAAGRVVAGLGASTKGNVLLQFCGLDERDLCCIGEVNPDKFGRYTPGTLIPIVSEDELFKKKPEVLVVLPWHFRSFFKKNPRYQGLPLHVPLPRLEPI